jgi:exopolysaccharide production protein ExoZ
LSKLNTVQVFRGLACLAVILSHAMAKAKGYDVFVLPSLFVENYDVIVLGHFGVDLFFILSGFIIYIIHQNDFNQPKKIPAFILSRLVRVVPIYWLLTLVALMLLLFFPQLFIHRSNVEFTWAVSSFLFMPSTTTYGVDTPILGVGWSLNYEMYFYVIFSLLLFLRKQTALIFILIYSLLIFIFSDKNLSSTTTYSDIILSPLVLEFALGILAGVLYKNFHDKLNKYKFLFLFIGVSIIALSSFQIPHAYFDRLVVWGGGSFFLVLFACLYNFKVDTLYKKIAVKLGDASYSAYLLQVFTLPFFSKVFFFFSLNLFGGFWLFTLFITVLTLLSSLCFYRFIEVPLTNFLKVRVVK